MPEPMGAFLIQTITDVLLRSNLSNLHQGGGTSPLPGGGNSKELEGRLPPRLTTHVAETQCDYVSIGGSSCKAQEVCAPGNESSLRGAQ